MTSDGLILIAFLSTILYQFTVYTLKALLSGGTPQDGISKYIQHISSQQVLFRYWSIWFPVQCLNFAVVPEHLRVPFGAFISFFWVCLLSSIAAQDGDEENVTVDQSNQQNHFQQDPFAGLQAAIDQIQFHPLYQNVQQWASPFLDSSSKALSNSAVGRTARSLPQPSPVRVPVYKSPLSDHTQATGQCLPDTPRYG